MQTPEVRVGDHVRVRRQRWLVTGIRAHEDCSSLTLSGLGPVNLGFEQQILTPFDEVEPIGRTRGFRIVRATCWRRACRQLIADDGPAGILRTARKARMDLLPHQLEPSLAVIHGHGTRILIADDVGLGKTVQAALIIAELVARGAASRVLVLTPAGLREQWVDELANRFDLRFTLFDMAAAGRRRASLPVGVNPWAAEPLVVSSIDYIKRPEVAPAVQACRWDVVVVDEAHHATAGTDRHQTVEALCSRAPYVVLLTATPHNGDPDAFRSLCALGEHDDGLLFFRRSRKQTGHPLERRIHQLHVRSAPEERRMHAALATFVRAVQREPGGREASTWLALTTLRKRALSSAFALQRSVEHRLDALDSTSEDPFRQLALPLFDETGEFDAADEAPPWTVPGLRDRHRERDLLSRVAQAAALAIGHESKLTALARLLRRVGEPAIVFTEYRDTLRHVRDRVAPHATVLHGGMPRDERRAAMAAFKTGGVLLATDAAGEGLNLHHTCRIVVNLELPWNPMRLEQRIGRVDRIGQTRRVHVFHLIAGGTVELRVLNRLGIRVATAQAEVGIRNPLGHGLSSVNSPEIATARMETQARREHDRLVMARRVAPEGSRSSCSLSVEHRALVTFSRRRTVRSALKSGGLILFRSVLATRSGQPVACHLTPVQLTFDRAGLQSFTQLQAVAEFLKRDDAREAWLATSLSVHRAFWTARVTRERAIAFACAQEPPGELQPGLFDWRTEHAWADEQERERAAVRERTWRTAAAANELLLAVDPPHIVLVLFTR